MLKILQKHRIFFTIYALFLVVTTLFLVSYSKQDIHLYLNSLNKPSLDVFFKYITYLGDGVTVALIGVGALFVSRRMGIQILGAGILSGIFAQLFKKKIFGPVMRPSKFFDELGIPLNYVEGVKLHGNFSFPSGHTTAAFALVTSLLLLQKSKQWDLVLIVLGVMIGYSRIYLSQHFLADVFAGSILGVLVAFGVYFYLYSSKLIAYKGLDKPLINFNTKQR